MSFRNAANSSTANNRHGHLQVSSDSLAESISTFRSTPDSSADSDDDDQQQQQQEQLHGIDLEEQIEHQSVTTSYSTADVQNAAPRLGGNSKTVSRASVASSIGGGGGGLPPRSPANNCTKTPNKSNTSSYSTPPPKMSSPEQRSLSKVSTMYDRTNKGYLDEQEQKMRSLDTAGAGHLSNEQVYDILRASSEQNRKMATQRHLIIALGCFATILALANMGSAFAAAYLAKDTEITASGELASKDTHERVATTAKGFAFSLGNPVLNQEVDDGSGGRRLGLSLASGMLNYHISAYNTVPKEENAYMYRLLTSSSDTGIGAGYGTSLVKLNWACGKDGVGGSMSGIIESEEKIVYTNATGSGLNGTLYTYGVKFHSETLIVAVDCIDDDTVQDCAVDGTNCCMTNDDCGEGTACNTCGCQCTIDDGMMNKCDSRCEEGLGEEIFFRP